MYYALLAAEEIAEEPSNPIIPVWNELFWGAISFFLLWALIRYVLLPPVQRAMNDRAATIQADRDAADAAKAQAVSASTELEDQLAGVRAEAASIIEQARSEADAERERLVARAEREVAAMREIAETEIQTEREQAMQALRPQVADLAVGAASKVMNGTVDLGRARPVVNQILNSPN